MPHCLHMCLINLSIPLQKRTARATVAAKLRSANVAPPLQKRTARATVAAKPRSANVARPLQKRTARSTVAAKPRRGNMMPLLQKRTVDIAHKIIGSPNAHMRSKSSSCTIWHLLGRASTVEHCS
jgi:hypothetical protein